jgi:NAD(P)-dependent dehydrogenase (short-subunit alcohol dehydrogenase family)
MEIEGKVAVVSGGGPRAGRARREDRRRGHRRGWRPPDRGYGRREGRRYHVPPLRRHENGGPRLRLRPGHRALRRLDIAFNNAGIGGEDLFADDPGDWKRVIEIDLTAVIDATRLAVRKMRLVGNAGAIDNTASLIGLWPMPSAQGR